MSQPISVSSRLVRLICAGHDQSPVPAIAPRLTPSRQLRRVSFPNPFPTQQDARAAASASPGRQAGASSSERTRVTGTDPPLPVSDGSAATTDSVLRAHDHRHPSTTSRWRHRPDRRDSCGHCATIRHWRTRSPYSTSRHTGTGSCIRARPLPGPTTSRSPPHSGCSPVAAPAPSIAPAGPRCAGPDPKDLLGQTRLLLDRPPLHRHRLPTVPAGMTQKHPRHTLTRHPRRARGTSPKPITRPWHARHIHTPRPGHRHARHPKRSLIAHAHAPNPSLCRSCSRDPIGAYMITPPTTLFSRFRDSACGQASHHVSGGVPASQNAAGTQGVWVVGTDD